MMFSLRPLLFCIELLRFSTFNETCLICSLVFKFMVKIPRLTV